AMHPLIESWPGYGRLLIAPFNVDAVPPWSTIHLVSRPEQEGDRRLDSFRSWLRGAIAETLGDGVRPPVSRPGGAPLSPSLSAAALIGSAQIPRSINMKRNPRADRRSNLLLGASFAVSLLFAQGAAASAYQQTNLVTDNQDFLISHGFSAAVSVDPNLINPWG